MTNRREFLETGAALSVLAVQGLAPRGAAAAAAARSGSPLPHCTLYDERYAECRAFASAARASGASVRSITHGDITEVYDELDVAWRTTPAAIAGTTQFGPMFVIERLANERRMRTVLRAEHQPAGSGGINHVLSAPDATLNLAAELCAAELDWPAIMAALVCGGVAPGTPRSRITLTTRAASPVLLRDDADAEAPFVHYYVPQRTQQGYAPALDGTLYTWLIAPATKRS